MDVLLDAGLPVDHAPIVWPLILEAVGNMHVALAEYLVSRGADLDREWPEYGSVRSLLRSLVENLHDPRHEEVQRLVAICNAGTVDEILAKADAKRPSPPPPEERTLRAMQLAADDAARQGQSVVTTENMLVGLLRVGGGVFAEFFARTETDMAKLRSILEARLLPDADPLLGQDLPADADAAAALRVAAEEADAHHRWQVSPLHLLRGILSHRNERVSKLLAEVGTDESKLRENLRSWL